MFSPPRIPPLPPHMPPGAPLIRSTLPATARTTTRNHAFRLHEMLIFRIVRSRKPRSQVPKSTSGAANAATGVPEGSQVSKLTQNGTPSPRFAFMTARAFSLEAPFRKTGQKALVKRLVLEAHRSMAWERFCSKGGNDR